MKPAGRRRETAPKFDRSVAINHEHAPYTVVEWFMMLDMDRTVLNTDNFGTHIYQVFGLSEAEAAEVDMVVKRQKGQGFDTFGYLAARFSERIALLRDKEGSYDFEAMAEGLVQLNGIASMRQNLLVEGATELFDILSKRAMPHAMLTTGEEDYQSLKLAVLRRLLDRSDLRAKIVSADDVPDKTLHIIDAYWDEEQQLFMLPEELRAFPLASRNIIVVDDKESNLATQHSSLHAFHIGTHNLGGITHMIDKKPRA